MGDLQYALITAATRGDEVWVVTNDSGLMFFKLHCPGDSPYGFPLEGMLKEKPVQPEVVSHHVKQSLHVLAAGCVAKPEPPDAHPQL